MRTIETTGKVTNRGNLLVHVSEDIPRGEHRIVVVLGDMPARKPRLSRMTIPVLRLGSWPRHLSLRREDLYGDDGR